jgi:hypothetical protein
MCYISGLINLRHHYLHYVVVKEAVVRTLHAPLAAAY